MLGAFPHASGAGLNIHRNYFNRDRKDQRTHWCLLLLKFVFIQNVVLKILWGACPELIFNAISVVWRLIAMKPEHLWPGLHVWFLLILSSVIAGLQGKQHNSLLWIDQGLVLSFPSCYLCSPNSFLFISLHCFLCNNNKRKVNKEKCVTLLCYFPCKCFLSSLLGNVFAEGG